MTLCYTRILAAALAIAAPAMASAQQFAATPDIFTGTGYAKQYIGRGGTVQPSGAWLGSVHDGGFDSFDNFGFYNAGVGVLAQDRQVDLLSGNVFRFFDTFTNTSSATITTTVNFFGNLGSDGDERISHQGGGLIVTCEDDFAGGCANDAVLALVSGNNGLAQQSISPDRYNVGFALKLAAGESTSLMNYAFLARDANGPLPSDVALALTTGQQLLRAPRLDGLTNQQIGRIANFTFAAPVPEPASWAMLIVGIGALGAMTRRTRRRHAKA